MSKEMKLFEQDLGKQYKEMAVLLPEDIDPKRFCRTVVSALASHPQSAKLLAADRMSLFNAAKKAATAGLMVDSNESTFVCFKDQVTLIPMVAGLIKLARNSGEVSNIEAHVVHQHDEFSYRPGMDGCPVFSPNWFSDRGAPIGAYAVLTLKNGEHSVSILREDEIMNIASSGRNVAQYDPKQGKFFGAWWKKAALRQVLKFAPKSPQLQAAIDTDNDNHDQTPRDVTPAASAASAASAVTNINKALDTPPNHREPSTAPGHSPQAVLQSDVDDEGFI